MSDDDFYGRNTTYDPERNVVYVRKSRCETCIFGRNKPVSQRRVNGMVAEADRERSSIPCHKHLYVDEDVQPICRGYFDHAVADGNNITLRLAQLMEMVEYTT